jgi:hypothetical protein
MRSPDDTVIEDTRQRLEPYLKYFAGDMTGAVSVCRDALYELQEAKEVRGFPEWAYDVIVKLATQGAEGWNRGRGNRTTYHLRDEVLKTEAARLMKNDSQLPLIGACRIISKALPLIPGAMTAEAIKTAIRPKSGN